MSKRRLLDWVTADDAEKKTGKLPMGFPRLCALAVFASLPLQPLLLLPGVPLCVLWWTADALSAYLERPREQAFAPDPSQRETLMDLAARTWRFFEDTVEDNGLPPDNEQLDPPMGLARRTSPTNAALYLMCCVSARELGLIDGDECIRRVETALETLESLEKWEGQLYNWYDTRTGKPLFPRYVSAVDSGNLAAALMCCAQSIPSLGGRLHALAAGMNLRALHERHPDARDLAIVIGPEGGISPEEIAEMAGEAVTLGPRILRTETAAVAAMTLAMSLWGDI